MQTAEQEVVIASPTVEPFDKSKFSVCRSCGHCAGRWSHFMGWLKGMRTSIAGVSYCPGGKPVAIALPPLQQMFSGETESTNVCAGVFEPHLHVRCAVCGFSFLMATSQPIQRAI